jgi:putative endonuclease
MGYMYILECSNGTFYTGSTKNLDRRLSEHCSGVGANYTRKNPPIRLAYFEEFSSVALAFQREKQIQNWSQSKKQALIDDNIEALKLLAECRNFTKWTNVGAFRVVSSPR